LRRAFLARYPSVKLPVNPKDSGWQSIFDNAEQAVMKGLGRKTQV